MVKGLAPAHTYIRCVEVAILRRILYRTPQREPGWLVFPRAVAEDLDLEPELIKVMCRSLRDRGLLELGKAFSEDGRVMGSGYALTAKGELFTKRHLENAIGNAIADPDLEPQKKPDASAGLSG